MASGISAELVEGGQSHPAWFDADHP